MTWHLYLLPVIGDGTKANPRTPKYLTTLGADWGAVDYGFQPAMLASADVSDPTDAGITNNNDVTRIPDNLELNVAVNATKAALESLNIPADWVQPSDSYREILRIVWGMFAYFQRYSVISGNTNPLMDGVNVSLSTQFNQLPQKVRQDLIATATDMGLDTSGLSGTNTLRQILKAVSDQWGHQQFQVGGITI